MFINFYDKFSLNRSMTEAEIKQELGNIQRDIIRRQGTTHPNDTVTLQELQENMVIVQEAIQALTTSKKRQAYDKKLDAALAQGKTAAAQQTNPQAHNELGKAKAYFAKGEYEFAVKYAKQAMQNGVNSPEPYEIICRSLFIQGDYEDAVKAADAGAGVFSKDKNLHWLSVRFRIQMERYQEAQQRINTMRGMFGVYSELAAEQVYLYYFAEKDEAGKHFLDNYIQKNPNDKEFRKATANNLIDISHQMYSYDQDADMLLITEKNDYDRALNLVLEANKLYQDNYTKREMDVVKIFGETSFDTTHKNVRWFYRICAVAGFLYSTDCFLENGQIFPANGQEWILNDGHMALGLGILCVILSVLVTRVSMRPRWQAYRDSCRGFHESDDSLIYNVLAFPLEMVKEVLWAVFG